MSEERIKALEEFAKMMGEFMQVQAEVNEASARTAQSMGQTMGGFAEHIDAMEGAMMKLIRIVDPDGAERNFKPDGGSH